MAKAFDRDLLARVRRDPKVNALVRALGGWEQVKVIDMKDLRGTEISDSANEQLDLTFTTENLHAGK
jgi:hypothetical protein